MAKSNRKTINLVVDEKLYNWIRKEAFKKHVSMNKLIRGYLLPHAKLKDDIKNALKERRKTNV